MTAIDHPVLYAAGALIALFCSGWIGRIAASRRQRLADSERADFGTVVAATLTLLGLIVGFSFSMALSRYDLRKSYEEAEANAIGTEYLRADLLAQADATKVKELLRLYLQVRIDFYTTVAVDDLARIDARTTQLQGELWSAVRQIAVADRSAVTALVVAGMNDVLNSQGYAQAVWWNRIPLPAWALMMIMALCSTFLVGYNAKDTHRERGLLLVLPIVLSISFYLIADIESPRGGFIRVSPQNLLALMESFQKSHQNR